MCLVAATCVQVEAKPREPILTKQALVSADLKNSTMKQALDQIFKGTGKSYILSFPMSELFNEFKVTLKIDHASLEQALNAVLGTVEMTFKRQNGVYVITEKDGFESPWSQNADSPYNKTVTVNIPAMHVDQALRQLYSKCGAAGPWKFKGALGNTPFPGARFSNFSLSSAGVIVIAASGLVPPVGTDRSIASKGKVALVDLMPNDGQSQPGSISVAAYKPQGSDAWLFTILANGSPGDDLVKKLLTTSGANYNILEPGSGHTVANVGSMASRLVTMRLVNATLDDALKAVLDPLGIKFHKDGSRTNPTYVIEDYIGLQLGDKNE